MPLDRRPLRTQLRREQAALSQQPTQALTGRLAAGRQRGSWRPKRTNSPAGPQLQVHVLSVAGDALASVAWEPLMTARELKRRVEGSPPGPRADLVHNSHVLPPDSSLAQCGVSPEATLVLVRRRRDLICSASFDKTVRLWHLGSAGVENATSTFCHINTTITAMVADPDSMMVLLGSATGDTSLCQAEFGQRVRVFRSHQKAVSCLAADWHGRCFCSGSWDHSVVLWDLDRGVAPLKRFDGSAMEVTSVSLGLSALRVISASRDGILRVYDLSGRWTKALVEPSGSAPTALKVDWDSGRALVGTSSGLLRRWQLAEEVHEEPLEGHQGEVLAIAVSWAQARAVTASEDFTLRLWDLASWCAVRVFVGHSHIVWHVAVDWSTDRAVSSSHDATVRVWDLTNAECLHLLCGHKNSVVCSALL